MTGKTPEVTPALALFASTLARLGTAIPLTEINGVGNGPWRVLVSQAPFHKGPCGDVRLFTGPGLFKIVTCSITAPAIGLDSHMLFAFSFSDGGVPHFTVDCVQSGDVMAFHLDLIPRLDLGTHLAYMDWAFSGLNDMFLAVATIAGLAPAHVTPRQRAVMSPWMVVHRATRQAFDDVEPLVHSYLDHWLSLLATGAPLEVLGGATPAQLRARDKANKAIIFDPDVDKVWNQIRGLIGHESVEAVREQLLQTGTSGAL